MVLNPEHAEMLRAMATMVAVAEIRERAMEAAKTTPWTFRNRHERRKAAALARRGVPSIADAANAMARGMAR